MDDDLITMKDHDDSKSMKSTSSQQSRFIYPKKHMKTLKSPIATPRKDKHKDEKRF
jgi:hypothetical protein